LSEEFQLLSRQVLASEHFFVGEKVQLRNVNFYHGNGKGCRRE